MSDLTVPGQNSNPIKGVEPAPPPPSAPSKSATSSSSSKSFDGTLEGLKEVNEEVYNSVMEAAAQTILKESKKQSDEIKKMNKEARRFLEGG